MNTPTKKNPYRGNNIYALSICPADQYQYFCSPNRMKLFRDKMNSLLMDCFNYHKIDYIQYIELSTPLGKSSPNYSGPRLHLHGIIVIKKLTQLKDWLLNGYPKLVKNCMIEIDTINDIQTWIDYVLKDQDWIHEKPFTNWQDTGDFYTMVRAYAKPCKPE